MRVQVSTRKVLKFIPVFGLFAVFMVIAMFDNIPKEPMPEIYLETYNESFTAKNFPTIFIITPTYRRAEQKPALISLSNTLGLVQDIHWIVVEDSSTKTQLVENILKGCSFRIIHLNAVSPKAVRENYIVHRGVTQRNEALIWLRTQQSEDGVVYFADDDNTYDVHIFEEMRFTKKVSVWPVGLIGDMLYEAPLVKDGQVSGWKSSLILNRTFEIDMAGFAVTLKVVKGSPFVFFRMSCGKGQLEDDLLRQFGFKINDLEPKADNCSKILVWHTKSKEYNPNIEKNTKDRFGSEVWIDTDV